MAGIYPRLPFDSGSGSGAELEKPRWSGLSGQVGGGGGSLNQIDVRDFVNEGDYDWTLDACSDGVPPSFDVFVRRCQSGRVPVRGRGTCMDNVHRIDYLEPVQNLQCNSNALYRALKGAESRAVRSARERERGWRKR